MPIVTVAMFSGRTQTEKDRLAEAITEDIIKILKVEKKEAIVVIQEAPRGNWYPSGIRV
ncbi:tautomerase family protein [Nitrososphaera sp. AFS]|uniref:tautomerase family protein n=1 Tax=Nitrososphaera sp. AFS TaxID=2301191 RepID=UPI00139246B1|nr:tautomerase family protein [Nitrososphaera sp. AFS]NAL78917.1 4-oxalocrotonate tautomerase [Nitrososphaera sp. AFS]